MFPSRLCVSKVIFIPAIFILFIGSFFPASLFSEVVLSAADTELLDEVEQRALKFFVEERNPANGLIRDRAHNWNKGATRSAASIASVGFGLTAYPVGVERGWLDRETAKEMTRRILKFFLTGAANEKGFFYHFLDMETGNRVKNSELSPIDTALLLAGVLFAAEYYQDDEILTLANQIYERVDWQWMLHGGETLALAWSPENGFSKRRWDHFDESMIMYLLAIGSPTYPIPAASWKAIARPVGSYRDYRMIQMPPLFTHHYSHIWVDFRDKNDGQFDYFKNSVHAGLANRAFCMDQSAKFPGYSGELWGLSASDGPFGYRAYGAPPGWAEHDGTISPSACGSSIVFTPAESLACLRKIHEDYQEKAWGQYGFPSGINPSKDWFGPDVIGIDQGSLLLMIENYRSGLIWDVMGRNQPLQKAMESAGFRPGTLDIPWPEAPSVRIPYIKGGVKVDGYFKDWPSLAPVMLDVSRKENGDIMGDEDLKGEIRFAWDENALYFSALVTDDSVLVRRNPAQIWQDDLLELYIDPDNDGLFWYDVNDFQIGFRVNDDDEQTEVWSWFQGGDDPRDSGGIESAGYLHEKGYVLEGSIRWDFLGTQAKAGMEVALSPALHDIDKDRTEGKAHWFFRNEQAYKRFALGRLILESPAAGNPV